MASPHSAGAVALLWSCNAALVGQIDQTFQALQDTADAPPAGSCGAPPDGEGNYTYGYGYLNILAAGAAWCDVTPTPPAAPTNLVATAVSQSQIDLTWTDNAYNESGFEIERSPDGSAWVWLATVGANVTSYPDTGLDPETTYYYRTRAFNGAGYSDYSNVDSATTFAAPGTVHVSNIEMGYQQLNKRKYLALANVSIQDQNGGAVQGANVRAEWTLPNGKKRSQERTTDAAGVAAFSYRASPGQTYQICVTDVIKTGWLYDPGQNAETCDTVTIP
jgi:hypothetical protein